MKKVKENKGFTLIEILVVIGIIAILAAIVLIAINPAKQFEDANDTQRSANVNAILNAVGQYMVDNNGTLPEGTPAASDPLSFSDIDDSLDGAGASSFCEDLVPTYISALPVDPNSLDVVDTNGDGQISVNECSSYNTGYEIAVSDDGRVTVRAEAQGDLDDDPVTDDYISVTR